MKDVLQGIIKFLERNTYTFVEMRESVSQLLLAIDTCLRVDKKNFTAQANLAEDPNKHSCDSDETTDGDAVEAGYGVKTTFWGPFSFKSISKSLRICTDHKT